MYMKQQTFISVIRVCIHELWFAWFGTWISGPEMIFVELNFNLITYFNLKNWHKIFIITLKYMFKYNALFIKSFSIIQLFFFLVLCNTDLKIIRICRIKCPCDRSMIVYSLSSGFFFSVCLTQIIFGTIGTNTGKVIVSCYDCSYYTLTSI